MADLNCYMVTFNCGRTLLDVDYFAAHFFDGLKTNLPPDLVILSLQEIAPLGHSFIGGSFLTPYLTRFPQAVNVAASRRFENQDSYVKLVIRHVGMTALVLLARPEVAARVRQVETAGVGVGVWEMGNKGAIGARIALESPQEDHEPLLTFVAAHLAPMEGAWERRNQDWKAICEGLVFEKDGASGSGRATGAEQAEAEPLLSSSGSANQEGSSLFSPLSQIFFGGDLNYRTSDTPPTVDAWRNWPKPADSVSNIKEYSDLFRSDQLTREKQNNKTLHNLAESEIAFPPTYKYSSAAQKDAALGVAKHSIPSHDLSLASPWAKHRIPSWCDRILYLAASPPDVRSYTALPVQPTSDHRPVALSFSIPLKKLEGPAADVKSPFGTRKDWKEARAAARRYEFVVGVASYLALTWEGEALLAGSVVGILGGYLILRAMLAG